MITVESFEKKLQNFIAENRLIASGEHILIALSGGVDSAVLLYALKQVSEEEPFTLSALHVNHKLRGAAASKDEQKAREMCAMLGVPFYCVHEDVAAYAKQNKISVELAGRKIRYQKLFALKKIVQADKIATAHHSQDHVETVVMRCLRGSGIAGLQGIAAKRQDGVIRPLLIFDKDEIFDYAYRRKIKYAIDATNAQNNYTRNRIRNVFIARCKEIDEHFETYVRRLARCARGLNEQIERELEDGKRQIVLQNGKVMLPFETVQQLKPYLRSYLIRAMFECIEALSNIEERHIQQILSMPSDKTVWKLHMPGNICFEREYERYQIKKKQSPIQEKSLLCFTVNKSGKTEIQELNKVVWIEPVEKFEKNRLRLYEKYIDCDKINGNLCLRNKRERDRFSPLGLIGSKSLKKYFIDCKIPKTARNNVMLLCDEKEIIWVLGHEISEKYKVDAQTKNIIKITVMQLR